MLITLYLCRLRIPILILFHRRTLSGSLFCCWPARIWAVNLSGMVTALQYLIIYYITKKTYYVSVCDRVGYYVNNEYDSEEMRAEPPEKPDYSRLVRSILADKPRVTRFPIAWTKELPVEELPPVEGNPDQEPAEFEIHHKQQPQDQVMMM